MTAPAPPGVDPAPLTPGQACLRLLFSLVIFGLVVVPAVGRLPLGPTARFGILAWLMVGVALYWMLADLGAESLLRIQLFLFSLAASALSAKAFLVWIGIRALGILRDSAIGLLVLGGACATANLLFLLHGLLFKRPRPRPPADSRS